MEKKKSVKNNKTKTQIMEKKNFALIGAAATLLRVTSRPLLIPATT